MSAPRVAPFLPFRRVRIGDQRVQADPAFAVVDPEPDRRFLPRCARYGGRARRIHSRYRRRVRDLSLGAHRVRLRRHRRGIVAHARYPISTGRLEGVNNKIKVIMRRSDGFRDPTYFTLKVKQAFPRS